MIKESYLHKNLQMQVNLKSFCNLRCDYCALPQESKSDKQSDEGHLVANTKKLIEKIKKEGYTLERFFAYGAEPTVVSASVLGAILQVVADSFPMCSVGFQTNGTLLNQDYVGELLKNFRDENRLFVFWSIDGVKKLHDKHRNNSYDRAMENLLYVAKHTKVFNRVTCTTNIEHYENEDTKAELVKFVKILQENDIALLMAAADMTINGISDSSIKNIEFSEKYCDFIIENDLIKECGKLTSSGFCYRGGNECHKTLFDINNGNVYLCEKGFDSQTVLSNWFEDSIEKTMQNRCEATSHAKIDKECFTCEFAMWCMGGCPIRRTSGGLSHSCHATKKILTHIKEHINEDWHGYLLGLQYKAVSNV